MWEYLILNPHLAAFSFALTWWLHLVYNHSIAPFTCYFYSLMLNVLIALGNLVWFLFHVEVFRKNYIHWYIIYSLIYYIFINIFPIFFIISVYDAEILIPLNSPQFMLSSFVLSVTKQFYQKFAKCLKYSDINYLKHVLSLIDYWSLCEGRTSFCLWLISRKLCRFLVIFSTGFTSFSFTYFFFLYQSPSLSLHTVFDSI